jgi:hypothetical protein
LTSTAHDFLFNLHQQQQSAAILFFPHNQHSTVFSSNFRVQSSTLHQQLFASLCFFSHHQRHPLQSSLFINSGDDLLFSPASTIFSSDFRVQSSTLHQQFFASLSFFSIINGILFSLHSSSTTSSSIFINNTLLFFPSSRHQWLVDFLFSLHRKLFYL